MTADSGDPIGNVGAVKDEATSRSTATTKALPGVTTVSQPKDYMMIEPQAPTLDVFSDYI